MFLGLEPSMPELLCLKKFLSKKEYGTIRVRSAAAKTMTVFFDNKVNGKTADGCCAQVNVGDRTRGSAFRRFIMKKIAWVLGLLFLLTACGTNAPSGQNDI